ncbi:MAG TPA: peptidylprolyl isomerase [Thermohalobaculum sp.]|nr:peptidylprolyl isomerase [Thermohalobaculum sp.]
MRELIRGLRLWRALALPVWLLALALPGAAQTQQVTTPFAPVAVVNGDPVTGFDLEQRVRLLRLLADVPADSGALSQAALEQLIEDRLKIQAGSRAGIAPTEEALAAGIAQFAESRGMTAEALRSRLERAGVTELAFEDLIAAEVVWLELVRGRYGPGAEPDAGELDSQLGQIAQAAPGTAYRLQEIGLPAEPGAEADALAQAQALAAQLAQGADFTAAVRQYSQAPSAARDGEVGWVDADRLPPELAVVLATLEPGQVSGPIRVGPGYSIVRVLEVRQGAAPAAAAPEVREQVRRQMMEQRMGQAAQTLMQELRRDALVERR